MVVSQEFNFHLNLNCIGLGYLQTIFEAKLSNEYH